MGEDSIKFNGTTRTIRTINSNYAKVYRQIKYFNDENVIIVIFLLLGNIFSVNSYNVDNVFLVDFFSLF